jgi:hypothetical protein
MTEETTGLASGWARRWNWLDAFLDAGACTGEGNGRSTGWPALRCAPLCADDAPLEGIEDRGVSGSEGDWTGVCEYRADPLGNAIGAGAMPCSRLLTGTAGSFSWGGAARFH